MSEKSTFVTPSCNTYNTLGAYVKNTVSSSGEVPTIMVPNYAAISYGTLQHDKAVTGSYFNIKDAYVGYPDTCVANASRTCY